MCLIQPDASELFPFGIFQSLGVKRLGHIAVQAGKCAVAIRLFRDSLGLGDAERGNAPSFFSA